MLDQGKAALALILLATSCLSSVVDARVFGKKKKGVKGKYMVIESGVNLADYRGALVILGSTEVVMDRDRPADREQVRRASVDHLRYQLESLDVFGAVVSVPPAELPAGQPVLELKTALNLRYGSQKKRFWIGFGAGKSKLHIRIDILDAKSGQQLGYFNGYGTGATWSPGGGVPFMAAHDLAKSYFKLAEYLVLATR